MITTTLQKEKRHTDLNKILALFPVTTSSPEETAEVGAKLMLLLQPGDVVALSGDLGSGKTQLVKGACAALNISPDSVTSPTFTLVQEYQGENLPIYHFDAYRVETVNEFYELGYEEYFFGDGICFIEWPEKVAPLIPDAAFVMQLQHAGDNRRMIRLLQPTEEKGDE